MKKRIFSVLLAVCMLAACGACLGGCQKNYGTNNLFKGETNLALKAQVSGQGAGVKKLTDGGAAGSWSLKKRGINPSYAVIDFGKEVEFNTVVLKEKTDAVKQFRIYAMSDSGWELIYQQDRIMQYRICYVEQQKTSAIKLEIVDNNNKGNVKISELEVYNLQKQEKEYRVSDYMRMDYDKETGHNELYSKWDSPDFYEYFNSITDVIVFGPVSVDDNGDVALSQPQEAFDEGMECLRKAIELSGADVRIWCTVFFDKNNAEGNRDMEATRAFLEEKREAMHQSLKAFTQKYDFYGLDYDWEYPNKKAQWDAYSQLLLDTAEYTHVSVALPSYGIRLSKEAVAVVEQANIMLYDMFDNRGDHSNTFSAVYPAIQKVKRAGFADSAICMGIPLYGRATNNSGDSWPNYFDGMTDEYGKPLGKWGNVFHDYPYVSEDENGKKTEYTCDAHVNGFAMVRDKMVAARQLGVGVMLFRMKCDAPATYEYSLHNAVKEVTDALF